ncbi:hypothetical protein Q5752_005269 [Cryptotrichosporon argae]
MPPIRITRSENKISALSGHIHLDLTGTKFKGEIEISFFELVRPVYGDVAGWTGDDIAAKTFAQINDHTSTNKCTRKVGTDPDIRLETSFGFRMPERLATVTGYQDFGDPRAEFARVGTARTHGHRLVLALSNAKDNLRIVAVRSTDNPPSRGPLLLDMTHFETEHDNPRCHDLLNSILEAVHGNADPCNFDKSSLISAQAESSAETLLKHLDSHVHFERLELPVSWGAFNEQDKVHLVTDHGRHVSVSHGRLTKLRMPQKVSLIGEQDWYVEFDRYP